MPWRGVGAVADTALAERTSAPSDEPGTRGRLEIRDRVVEKIAARAAAEVAQVRARSDGLLGLRRRSPSVRADVGRAAVHLAVDVEVCWPAPAGPVAARVRVAVTERLTALTGLRVRHVDVTVTPVRIDQTDRESRRTR